MGIGDDGVAAIHRAMIEIKEALGFTVAHHVATAGIGARDLGRLDPGLTLLLLQRLLAMNCPLRFDGPVEIGPVVGPGLMNHLKIILALVGIGLQMVESV
jgi:hypothetical protein